MGYIHDMYGHMGINRIIFTMMKEFITQNIGHMMIRPIYNYIQGKYKKYYIKRERKRIRKWKASRMYQYIINNITNKER